MISEVFGIYSEPMLNQRKQARNWGKSGEYHGIYFVFVLVHFFNLSGINIAFFTVAIFTLYFLL